MFNIVVTILVWRERREKRCPWRSLCARFFRQNTLSAMPSMGEESYTVRIEKWTSKEMQLNRLHEEVISKRESLMHCSQNYLRQQSTRLGISTGSLPGMANATLRNERLLKDIEDAKEFLAEEANEPPSPKFLTLQNNYWSMVKSLVPLWEQSCRETSLKEKQKQMEQSGASSAVGTGVTSGSPSTKRSSKSRIS